MKEQNETQAIEEMAAFLWKNTLIHTEDLCHDVAETVIKEGYRKQSVGEWIFKEYGEDTYTNLTRIYECSLCGRTIECLNEADEPYCHCGARMKGGAE